MSSVWGKGKRKSTIVRSGSPWTVSKLDALATYLRSYTIAGLHVPGRSAFIDAFVGASYRDMRHDDRAPGSSADLLMPDLAADEPQSLLDAIARMALETNPAFHAYIFVDRTQARRASIEELQRDFPGIRLDNAVRSGAASVEIETMCSLSWKERRAVMLLDPFGMQVEWTTIEAIARTQRIDLWILYPLGLGTARLLAEPSALPVPWRQHLSRLIGTESWFDEFVAAVPEPTLFRDEPAAVTAKVDVLGRYFSRRLASVFPTIAEQPQVLRGSTGQPLYLCSFAAGNDGDGDGAKAVRSANKLLARLSA